MEGWERDGSGGPAGARSPRLIPFSPGLGRPNASLVSTQLSQGHGGAAAPQARTPAGKSLLGEEPRGTPQAAEQPLGSPRPAGACWRGSRGSSLGSGWPPPCRPTAPSDGHPPARRSVRRSSCGCPPAVGEGGGDRGQRYPARSVETQTPRHGSERPGPDLSTKRQQNQHKKPPCEASKGC